MTEKRYVEINNDLWHYIRDRDTFAKYDFNEVVDLLNEQDDLLNEQVDVLVEQVNLLNEQDRQLKRLFNYFQDYLSDEMSANSFSEMFDNVKSDEKWD